MLVKTAAVLGAQPGDLLPKTGAPRMSANAPLLSIRGAEELLTSYAALRSTRQRRAVRDLVQALHDNQEAPNA